MGKELFLSIQVVSVLRSMKNVPFYLLLSTTTRVIWLPDILIMTLADLLTIVPPIQLEDLCFFT